MPNQAQALSHDEVLKRLCGVCLRKHLKGLKNISDNYLELIIKYYHKSYNVTNGNYPTVICPSCQRALRDAKASEKENKISKRKLPDNRYGSMRGPRALRSSTSCQCTLCFIWRLNGEAAAYKEFCEEVRAKPGRPLQGEPAPDPEVKSVCQDCQGERKQGVAHVCNVTSLENNTLKVIDGMSSASKQRVAAKLLDNIGQEQGVGKNGTMKIQGRGAHPKTITSGKTKVERRVTKEELMRIKLKLDLSGNQALHLRTFVRTIFGRKSVEEGAGDFQTELNHRLAGFFKLVHLKVKQKKKKQPETEEERWAVVCSDFEGLVQFLLQMRDIDPSLEEVLIGFDDGQGFLKLMLLIQSILDRDQPEKKRLRYSDGVFAKTFRNSGVKKLIPLAVVQDTQEQYSNIKQLLELVDVKGVENVSHSKDIKMVLMEQGRQGAQCSHPCIFGDGKPPYTDGCTELTVGELRRLYERYYSILNLLAPTGAQGVTICVRLSCTNT